MMMVIKMLIVATNMGYTNVPINVHRWYYGLACLFNGISTFVGYLMPKPFSKKNSSGTI